VRVHTDNPLITRDDTAFETVEGERFTLKTKENETLTLSPE
jgi:hypothetical protein